jgi:hypothetical protein
MSDHDDDLHDPDIRALYRKLPAETPSDATDAAIKAAARRAVGAGPQKSGWTAGRKSALATAAMLVLTVGLVVQMQRQSPEQLREAVSTTLESKKSPYEPESRTDVAAEAEAAAPAQPPRVEIASSAGNAAGPAAAPTRTSAPDKKAVADAPVAPPAAPAEITAAPAPAISSADETETDKLADSRARDEAFAARSTTQRSANAIAAPAAAAAKEERARIQEYSLAKEKKAAASGALTAQPVIAADYRQAMASRNYTQALQQLAQSETPDNRNDIVHLLDKDLLLQLTQPGKAPACATLAPASLGDSKPLCDLLTAHASSKPLPSGWRETLTRKNLWQDGFNYRRPALEELLGKQIP